MAIFNFTPVQRDHYRLGLPKAGVWAPVLNSDDPKYGGWGVEVSPVTAEQSPWGEYEFSGEFTLPPNSAVFFKRQTSHR